MGPQKWKRLVDAASRRYKALMVVVRDPAAAKQKAEAAEAARSVGRSYMLCGWSLQEALCPSLPGQPLGIAAMMRQLPK